jgi:transcriptional regulator with XRE-family HTH domain
VFVKTAERQYARRLRRDRGLPIKEIARLIGVSVSSVSLWVRDVPLSAEQEAALDARNPVRNGQRLGTINNSARCRAVRQEAQHHGRELARRGDPDFLAGCMLYWAEGSKRRNDAQIVNSDVELVRTFLRTLRLFYAVPDARIALSVNCFLGNGLSIDEIQD